MKIAVQLSGQPRFCADLTTFLQNFKTSEFDQVDWHIHLWKNNPRPDNHVNYHLTLVHDSWREPNEDIVRCVFKKNLPSNHNISTLQFSESTDFIIPEIPIQRIKCQIEHVPQVWRMWHGWKLVDQQRQEWEKNNGNYDLIVKARADCTFTSAVDISNSDQSGITVADRPWHGYQKRINDTLAIGTRDKISVYSSVIDYATEHANVVWFHPETILAFHLEKNQIKVIKGPWSIKFRTFKDPKTQEVDWGDWLP